MPVRGPDDRVVPPGDPGGAPFRPRAERRGERRLSGLGAPPSGYTSLRIGDTSWWVTPGAAEFLETAGAHELLTRPTRRADRPEQGRGGILHLRIGPQAAVGKRLQHGGALAGVTRGLFLGAGRIEAIVAASARLRAAGVPTPEVIAAGWRAAAGPFGALALLTATIEGGRNLLQLLPATRAGSHQRRLLLRAAGTTIARLEAAGFAHADLNLANLVATLEGEGARVAVVDLEGGRFVEATRIPGRHAGAEAGASAGLRRLMRSWEKWVEPKAPGSLRDLAAFLTGYSAERRERRLAARDLLRYRDRLGARRLRWRLEGASAVGR